MLVTVATGMVTVAVMTLAETMATAEVEMTVVMLRQSRCVAAAQYCLASPILLRHLVLHRRKYRRRKIYSKHIFYYA